MEGIKNISVRFPDELHARIKDLAERENRSLNREILELVKRGIESEYTKQLKLFG